ncbi:MAG: hypothetical protein DME22_04295 [Verrucomicrobia bacterium]|nr:MAG: hypothetical protein DME22_04295 [Verrucomicrobiota bacterium]PYJ99175.1 MAG: hypothetical protein DME23_10245 [Verrucomicrobiota bacterium]
MKKLRFGILGTILAAVLVLPWLIQKRAEGLLVSKRLTLQQQAVLLEQLSSENQRLSNNVAQVKSSHSLDDAALSELMKLRAEVGQLRKAVQEMEPLRRQVRRIREGLQQMEELAASINLTAPLVDEMEMRRARVAQLRQWLEDTPSEMIPELQFLSDFNWIDSVENLSVTDDEYRQTMSHLRSQGELAFSKAAFQALRQYAQANHGQFPADLSQLKPYFASPMDDALLERYEIVPAKNLNIESGVDSGEDWVITQKAPVNRDLDHRSAISLRGLIPLSLEGGRWDTVPWPRLSQPSSDSCSCHQSYIPCPIWAAAATIG